MDKREPGVTRRYTDFYRVMWRAHDRRMTPRGVFFRRSIPRALRMFTLFRAWLCRLTRKLSGMLDSWLALPMDYFVRLRVTKI